MKKLNWILFFFISTSFYSCYLAKQGYYLIHYQLKAENIEKILQQENVPLEKKEFLKLVLEIQDFASKEIGLEKTKNYQSFVEIEKDYLVNVVSASRKERFEDYLWYFPFFGSFPYKGFYEEEDAIKLAEKLKQEGYDVLIRKVDAFSTLGFFNDPVYSFMQNYSVYELAALIIHEQVHATIFLPNQNDFNENLASFIEKEGALLFLEKKFGKQSRIYEETLLKLKEREILKKWLHNTANQLDQLYKDSSLTTEEKIAIREKIFEKAKTEFLEKEGKNFQILSLEWLKKMKINNAYFRLFLLYEGKEEIFRKFYEKNNQSLPQMIQALKQIVSTKPLNILEILEKAQGN